MQGSSIGLREHLGVSLGGLHRAHGAAATAGRAGQLSLLQETPDTAHPQSKAFLGWLLIKTVQIINSFSYQSNQRDGQMKGMFLVVQFSQQNEKSSPKDAVWGQPGGLCCARF